MSYTRLNHITDANTCKRRAYRVTLPPSPGAWLRLRLDTLRGVSPPVSGIFQTLRTSPLMDISVASRNNMFTRRRHQQLLPFALPPGWRLEVGFTFFLSLVYPSRKCPKVFDLWLRDYPSNWNKLVVTGRTAQDTVWPHFLYFSQLFSGLLYTKNKPILILTPISRFHFSEEISLVWIFSFFYSSKMVGWLLSIIFKGRNLRSFYLPKPVHSPHLFYSKSISRKFLCEDAERVPLRPSLRLFGSSQCLC